MHKKDRAVSEIIGTMLVFAMVVTTFSALELWYVPSTEGAYEQQFQKESQAALVSLISQVESPSLSYGDVISQNVPLGIQGTLFSPSQASSISYQSGGFSSSLLYGLGINYKLLENTVPSAITNEVVGTIPDMNGIGPSQSTTAKGITYITDYTSNSMEEINATTHKLIGNFRVGLHPAGIAYDMNNGLLYISNFFNYTNYNGLQYSTITIFNPATNSIVKTINADGLDTHILYPSGIAYLPLLSGSGSGYLYVSVLIGNAGNYVPEIAVINTSTEQRVNLINTGLSSGGLEESNVTIVLNPVSDVAADILATDYWQNAVTSLSISILTQNYVSPTHSIVNNVASPYGIAYDPVANSVYVTNSPYLLTSRGTPHSNDVINRDTGESGNITVINVGITSPYVTMELPLNISEPSAITVIPYASDLGSTLYIANYNVSYNGTGGFSYSPIVAIDYTSGTGYSSSPNLSESYNYPNGNIQFLQGIDSLSTYQNQLIVSDNFTENTVFLIKSGGTASISYTWNNPFDTPVAIAYLNGTRYLAVVNAGSDLLNLIDTVSNDTVVKSFSVGQQPTSVCYDLANGYLYVTNNLSENVTIIDPSLSNLALGHTVANITLSQLNSPSQYADPSYAVYDPHNQSVYILDNGTGNLTQIVQSGKNFYTYNFSINLNSTYYAPIASKVIGPPGQFGKDSPLYNNGSEEFLIPVGSAVIINSLSLQLKGTGTVSVGIGTGNFTGANWNDINQGYASFSNINKHNGVLKAINLNISSVVLPAGEYYINVKASSGLHWLWALHAGSSLQQQYGDLQDFYFHNGVLQHDNLTPFGYLLGYNNPPSGSTGPPDPTSAVMSPSKNIMYVTLYGNANVSVVNLSRSKVPIMALYKVGLMPRSIAYDPLDNNIYVGNSGSGNVSVINTLNGTKRSFTVGSNAYPLALTMDAGNGYLYVGNNVSNNITLENTFTSQTINSIATGVQPSALTYDPQNGLIYVLDTGSNQMTLINGGSVYFNGHNGSIVTPSYTGKGQLVSYGYTSFVNPIAFYMQDGMILSNYSSSQYVTSSANVPVSVVENSGKTYFSSFILNLGGSPSSSSGTDTNNIRLSVAQIASNHVYQGQQFTHYDLYGNPYPAMVTNVTLTYFSYSISSDYASEINQILYSEFNLNSNGNLHSWTFTGYPFQVTLNAQDNLLSISSTQSISLYSVNLIYEDLTVINI